MKSCDDIVFAASRAIASQRRLASLLKLHPLIKACEERRIVALDVAYRRSPSGEYAFGVAVLYDGPARRILDCMVATRLVCVPYIPGLLAFREMTVLGPLALKASKQWNPDVLFVDGHGVSHPRRLGIASHIGLAVGKPSIGIAKKKLVGDVRGEYVMINGEPLARLVKTPSGSVIYVSPGYGVDLDTAYRIVSKYLTTKSKLPEPLWAADVITKASKKLIKPTLELKYHACPSLLNIFA
jgi:deoxyribonuclease V